MTPHLRAERLIARLDAFSAAAARLRHPDAERLVEIASVATMRAVALALLDADAKEKPGLPDVRVALPERLAA